MCTLRENSLRCWGKIDLCEPSLNASFFYMLTHFFTFKRKTILFIYQEMQILSLSHPTQCRLKRLLSYHLEANQKKWEKWMWVNEKWKNQQLLDKDITRGFFHLFLWKRLIHLKTKRLQEAVQRHVDSLLSS